ncbi:AraC family transcriptional regulator [Streptomyces sp. NPDC057620]|uniref:helix-turn-helix transcriptional regulator n=1 Tax=Streptomyces sp. NPDC057620 TaxID=3346185 RepID=UPI0036B3AD81
MDRLPEARPGACRIFGRRRRVPDGSGGPRSTTPAQARLLPAQQSALVHPGQRLRRAAGPGHGVPREQDRRRVRIGATVDEDTYVCCIEVLFEEANASVLFDVLPPVVLVRAGDPRGALLSNLSALTVAEMESAGVGRPLVLEHLAQLVLVHMLRVHSDQTDRPVGRLGALVEDGIGAALRAMHADASSRWTLDDLAAIRRMSRSAFVAAFKAKVGTAPLTYLIERRMSPSDALRSGTRPISELAAATGYESQGAFSTAFRRVVGACPRHFRDEVGQHSGVG